MALFRADWNTFSLASEAGCVLWAHNTPLLAVLDVHGDFRRIRAESLEVAEPHETRDRLRPLKVFVTADERAFIVGSADICRMSVSQYLRTVGMHGRPTNRFDHEAIRDMCRASGDLGRLGGLLKLWLSDGSGEWVPVQDIRALLREIEAGVIEVRMKVREIDPL